ncbi:basic amino acid ABC transporter substrate-binding protein [Butyrivibrio sp. NC3005]|jgi:polar amino acid transport system substrate-binding protein|uniref:basic amino acid ABC transporter substrate-binding protein n=1 Tax=Butyrivibrio sp. NC3005 TaxID=1280685 RepID=UPI0003F5A511|nr:basic amino acid ABC transporter substrate-binding protein [Butyrivibrio sp. NC3005]
MKKKILSAIMAVVLTASFCACGKSGNDDNTITMATNAEFPPYEYHDNNKIVGIDAEIAEAIANKLGYKLEIEDIAFDSIIPELSSKKADFGMAGMTVTEDRKKSVDFSDSYASARQSIIVPENSSISGPDDLKDKIVGVQTGTTGDLYVTDDLGDDHVERYNKGMEAVQALVQGKIDAVVIDNEPAKVFVSENKGLKILDTAYAEESYAIAVNKGNTELLDKINKALAELKEDGTIDKIIDKYITAE